jgi:hypothetical protein
VVDEAERLKQVSFSPHFFLFSICFFLQGGRWVAMICASK